MSVSVPTYMLASGLIAEGMNWIQAILAILLGNLIVLIPMLLNARAGTKYGNTASPSSSLCACSWRQRSRHRLATALTPQNEEEPCHPKSSEGSASLLRRQLSNKTPFRHSSGLA
jgi:hypothetical protein